MTTNWILSGECPNFPLMYHFRVLPASKQDPMNAKELAELESAVQYWDNTPAIRRRFEAVHNASAHIVLLIEYVPMTLHQWLGERIKAGGTTAEWDMSFIENSLKETTDFTSSHGFCHFDAHFKNILTDGRIVYFSDFGLVLSSKFALTKAETEFLNNHRTYDRCVTIVNLLYCLVTALYGSDEWLCRLREYINGEQSGEVAPSIDVTIKKYAPVALMYMDDFYRKLQNDTRSVAYPEAHMQHLLMAADSCQTTGLV
jgi:hypothetical protein